MHGRGRIPLLILLLSAGVTLTAAAQTPLQFLDWRAGLLGRGFAGTAVLISQPGEGWRAEVGGSRLPLESLLAASGDGWTLVGAPDGRVWGAPWGDPLRDLDSPLARTLTAAVAGLTPGSEAPQKLVIPQAGEAADPPLHRRLAARADGRGGPLETLTLRPAPDGAGLRLVSRRRHGGLNLAHLATRMVAADPADLLLPAWTLAEILERP